MSKWNCNFKKTHQTITVGDRLMMVCDQDTSFSNLKATPLKKELKIIFPNKEDEYRLKILKTLSVDKQQINLEVASYRTGDFSSSFVISDGLQNLEVDNFSFQVASVFSQANNQNQKPHGHFGPWMTLPFHLYFFSLLAACILLASFVPIFVRYFSRRKLAITIVKRLASWQPSKVFVKNIRQLSRSSPTYLEDMEIFFRIGLENLLFIFVLGKKDKQIMLQLKKYQNSVYKKYRVEIVQIFKELESLKIGSKRKQDIFKVERLCKNLVFALEKEKIK